jgi:hypothetical protein
VWVIIRIDDTEARQLLLNYAHTKHQEVVLDRSMEIEAEVLSVIRELSQGRGPQALSIKRIASRLNEKHGMDYDRAITPRWIGSIVRQKLHLRTYKSHGAFVVSPEEDKLNLYDKYGISDDDTAAFLVHGRPDDDLPLPTGDVGMWGHWEKKEDRKTP